MSTPARLAAFALALAVVFAAAAGVGNAVGPIGIADSSTGTDPRGDAPHDGDPQGTESR